MTLKEFRQDADYYIYKKYRIFYRSFGEGPNLVFFHGFPSSSWDWKFLIPTLSKQYRLILFDFIGFGLSDKPKMYAYSLMDQADLAEALLKELKIGDFHLIAHDYGDTVAQEFLARLQEGKWAEGLGQMLSVSMLNGGIIPGQHRPRPIQNLLASPIGKWVARMNSRKRFGKAFSRVFAPAHQPTEEELDEFWGLITYNEGNLINHKLIYYMWERKNYYDRWVGSLINPPIPTQFICGLQDPVSGAHLADAYEKAVQAPQIVRIPEAGHYPQWETPEIVLDALLSFLPKGLVDEGM